MAPWGMGAEGPGSVPEHPMGRNESRRDAEGGGDGSSAGGFFGKDHIHEMLRYMARCRSHPPRLLHPAEHRGTPNSHIPGGGREESRWAFNPGRGKASDRPTSDRLGQAVSLRFVIRRVPRLPAAPWAQPPSPSNQTREIFCSRSPFLGSPVPPCPRSCTR